MFRNDIGTEFGIENCGVLVLKRSKVTQSKGISLPDDITIKAIKEVKG